MQATRFGFAMPLYCLCTPTNQAKVQMASATPHLAKDPNVQVRNKEVG